MLAWTKDYHVISYADMDQGRGDQIRVGAADREQLPLTDSSPWIPGTYNTGDESKFYSKTLLTLNNA